MTNATSEEVRGLPALVRDLLACGDCGGDWMQAVSDGERTNFRCVACGACWHLELGWVSRVDPASCPGCEAIAECRGARP